MSGDLQDWPEWKLLLAKIAVLWCLLSGLAALLLVVTVCIAVALR